MGCPLICAVLFIMCMICFRVTLSKTLPVNDHFCAPILFFHESCCYCPVTAAGCYRKMPGGLPRNPACKQENRNGAGVTEIRFTPGVPFNIRGLLRFRFQLRDRKSGV